MGVYNFQKRFAPHILSGEKRHTIRALRKRPDKPGNTLHLYTGLRHPGARLLARVQCTAVAEIEITDWGLVLIDGMPLSTREMEELARLDGFESHAEMIRFWREP